MPRGFATAYLLLIVLMLAGVGTVLFSSSKDFAGLVLGAKSPKDSILIQTPGIKVTVISPDSSWDLVEYLCKSKNECEESVIGGRWWSTISGASTNQDGHEVFIEQDDDWNQYKYLKISVKSARGDLYSPQGTADSFAVVDLSSLVLTKSLIFVAGQ